MPTQLDRIEAAQKQILDGLKLKEQLDRIEAGMTEIAAHQSGGMTTEEQAAATDRLKGFATKLDGIGEGSPPQ